MVEKNIGPFQHHVKHQISEMEKTMDRISVQVLNNVQLFNTRLSTMAEPEDLKGWVTSANAKLNLEIKSSVED